MENGEKNCDGYVGHVYLKGNTEKPASFQELDTVETWAILKHGYTAVRLSRLLFLQMCSYK